MTIRKIVVAPDSFKGTMSARVFCEVAERAIHSRLPDCEVVKVPMADGGEGTGVALLAAKGGETRSFCVTGPRGEKLEASLVLLSDGRAVVECASAAGLPLMYGKKNPETATSFGVGELIQQAIGCGAQTVILTLGGSATNDGGCGAAAALGVRFFDKDGNSFVPCGGTLTNIARIDGSAVPERVRNTGIILLCDVQTCFLQAPKVFGRQKGADVPMILRLERGMLHLQKLFSEVSEVHVEALPGSGAAGGFAGGFAALFGAQIVSGAPFLLEAVGFSALCRGADYVFTGEGRLDATTAEGKTISAVARCARENDVPTVAFVGQCHAGKLAQERLALSHASAIGDIKKSFSYNLTHTKENLERSICAFLDAQKESS